MREVASSNNQVLGVKEVGSAGSTGSTDSAESVPFATIYDRHFEDVCRWLRAHNVRPCDVEDVAHEVFLTVRAKLGTFDGRNWSAWIYRITANAASDYRRRGWFKNLFRRRSEIEWEGVAGEGVDPEADAMRRERAQLVEKVVARMTAKRRTAFVLFEIEGYSGEEIADLEQIPIATVWTRLHHARQDFAKLLEQETRGGR